MDKPVLRTPATQIWLLTEEDVQQMGKVPTLKTLIGFEQQGGRSDLMDDGSPPWISRLQPLLTMISSTHLKMT